MADNNQRTGTQEFMDKLRDNITKADPVPGIIRGPDHIDPVIPPEVQRFAPPPRREQPKSKTRNQTIAEFIIALPWREAMAMGKGIQQKLEKENGGQKPTVEELTAAIQEWAWTWETFQDEERPNT